MQKIAFLAAAFLATGAIATLAQDGAEIEAAMPPVEVEELIMEMPDADKVTGVSYYDMSGNGQVEALVRLGEKCDQAYCEWKLFAETDDGWQAVGSGMAREVMFEPTSGSGAVVNADSITWAYSGGRSIYMWGDLMQGLAPSGATNAEYGLVGSTTQFDQTERMRLDKFEMDLNGDGSPERIFLVGGLFYKVGQWGTPYVIYDANDELVLSGISTDNPRIFPKMSGNGSIVINVTPAGLQINEIN